MIPLAAVPPKVWVGLAIAVAFLSMGAAIKVQGNQIKELERQQAIWEDANKKLADKLETQNDELRKADAKHKEVQSELDKVSGKNAAIAAAYNKIYVDLKNRPLPITCEDSLKDLREFSSDVVKKWNGK